MIGRVASLLRRKGVQALVIKIGSAAGALVMFALIARRLGDVEFGLYAFGMSIAFFLSMALNFGLPTLVLRYLPAAWETGNPDRAAGVLRYGLRRTGQAMLLTVPGIAIAAALSSVALDSANRPAFWAWTFLLAIGLIAADVLAHVLRSFGHVSSALVPRDIGWRYLAPVLVFAAVGLGAPADAVTAMAVTALLLAGLVGLQALAWRRLVPLRPAADMDPQLAREIDRAMPSYWGMSIAASLEQHATVAVVGWVLGEVAAGEVFVAMRVASLLSLPLVAGNVVAAPKIAVHHEKKEPDEVQRVCRELAIVASAFASIGVLAMIFAGRWMLSLFGPDYADALPLLLVFAAGQFWNAASGASGYLLSMTGNARELLVIQIVSNLLALLLAAGLAVLAGPIGAAIGIATGVVIWNTWARQRSLRILSVDPTILSILRSRRRRHEDARPEL